MLRLRHVASLLVLPAVVGAQRTTVLQSVGTTAEERTRLAQLSGAPTAGFLLRDGSDVTTDAPGVRVIVPELRTTWNSGLVAPANDGALWNGRGTNVLVRGGLTWGWRNLRVTLAPELTHSANAPVEVPAGQVEGWSGFSSPWRTAEIPADLPLRFGDAALTTILPGQSALAVNWDRVSVGMATGNLWWGPGLRNALVLSDHAPGIPHAFVKTPRPLASPVGRLEARLIAGGLTESLFFDTITSNDLRAVSGAVVTIAPHALSGLTLGLSRLVIAPVRGGGDIASEALAVLTTWNGGDARDQMSSVFGRWVAAEGGVEVWGEYGRTRLPVTLREAATMPNADAGWTAGAQWAIPRDDGALRLQVEFTDVAQSKVDPSREPRDWGTGRNAIHGFTQRGQFLGLATGPGSTHGWLAVDRIRATWSVGAFVARTRWENDAFYRSPRANFFAHDASVFVGARGTWRSSPLDATAQLSFERRYNYLFENATINPGNRGQRNIDNVQLSLMLTPRAPR